MQEHHREKLRKLGSRIRRKRKSLGMSMEVLAQKVGISKMTLHRIENGLSSPSIITLTEISQQLKQPLEALIREPAGHVTVIRKGEQDTIFEPEYGIRVVAPRGLISDRITATHAELEEGTVIEPHTNNGHEWAVLLDGKAVVTVADREYPIEAGDAIYYDARVPHGMRVEEKIRYIGIFVRGEGG